MNGALTFQLVKATTPDSAVELNMPGDPSMGYRLKKDATSQSNQLAQWTTLLAPPEQASATATRAGSRTRRRTSPAPSAASAAAPGADDPKDGMFGSGGGATSGGGTGTGTRGRTERRPSPTRSRTAARVTQTTTVRNPDGSVTVTRVYSYGGTESFTIPPQLRRAAEPTRAPRPGGCRGAR